MSKASQEIQSTSTGMSGILKKLDYSAPFFTKPEICSNNKQNFVMQHPKCGNCDLVTFQVLESKDETGAGIRCTFQSKTYSDMKAEKKNMPSSDAYTGNFELHWKAQDNTWHGKGHFEKFGSSSIQSLRNKFHVQLQDKNVDSSTGEMVLEWCKSDLPIGHAQNPMQNCPIVKCAKKQEEEKE